MASLDQLSTRERTLVVAFGVIFAGLVVVLAPLLVSASLDKKQKSNVELRESIGRVLAARTRIAIRRASLGDVASRYSSRAPSLGTLVDTAAKGAGLEIASQTDSAPLPRGKLYSERATKLTIQRTGLKALATFLEKIETTGFPVAVVAMELTKRIEVDSYAVNMTVAAFDRTEPTAAPATSAVRGGK